MSQFLTAAAQYPLIGFLLFFYSSTYFYSSSFKKSPIFSISSYVTPLDPVITSEAAL
jgi:hypothetical protein